MASEACLARVSFTSVEGPGGLRRDVLKRTKPLRSSGAILAVGGSPLDRLTLGREKGILVDDAMAEPRAVARGHLLSGHSAGGAGKGPP